MIDHDMPISMLCDEQTASKGSFIRNIWFPIGILLVLTRLFSIGLITILAIPFSSSVRKRFHFKLLKMMLGITVECNISDREIAALTEGCVVAANHVSLFDIFSVLDLPHTTILVGHISLKKVSVFSWLGNYAAFVCSGARFWHVTERRAFAALLDRWRSDPAGVALYTTPEKTIDNGKGLFRFHSAFLCYKMPVVPLAVEIRLPFGLNPHPLFSSSGAIFLRLMMLPWVRYTLTFLPQQAQQAGQTKNDFSAQVQRTIADQLGIPATNWTDDEKREWRQRRKDELSTMK